MKAILPLFVLVLVLTACPKGAPKFDSCPNSYTAAVAKYGEPAVQKSYDTNRTNDGKALFVLKRTTGTWTLANGVLVASFDKDGALTEHAFTAQEIRSRR